ncbi:MAG TPA: DUF58 domain-containing protein, partial [Candidatus Thermoplasmatota archaeon]|nr:DUF58 domain-containing protein [Candidatus Thermoplasmatota archaeon]
MRLTPRGRAAATTAAALWAASLVLASVAAAAAALAITAALAWALLTLPKPRVRAQRSLARDRFTEGEVVREELELTLLSPGRVRGRVEEERSAGLDAGHGSVFEVDLRRGQATRLALEWSTITWGRKRLGPLRIVVRDALGLLEADDEEREVKEITVQPAASKVGKYKAKAGNPEPALGAYGVSRPGDGSEFFALRTYQPGDSIRRINWKATARSTETIVNQVNRENFARVVLFVDLREKESLGGPLACSAVRNGRAAASILAHHERQRDHLCAVSVSDEPRRLSIAANPRLGELLEALANAPQGGDASLERAVRAHLDQVKSRSPIYFCTSGALDADLVGAIRVTQAMNARPVLVSPRLPALAEDAATAEAIQRSRDEALAAARGLGVPVVDWEEGKSLEVALAA